MAISDLFSTDPVVLARMADENVAFMKAELAKFDAQMAPHYDRLQAYYAEAQEDGDREAVEDYGDKMDRYRARWTQARQPYLQQIMQIALLKDGLTPREITFMWTKALYADIADAPVGTFAAP